MAGGIQGPFVSQNIGLSGPNVQIFSGSVSFGDRQLQQILADVNLLLAPLQQQLPYAPIALDARAWQPWPPVTYAQVPAVQYYPPFQNQQVTYYPSNQYMNLSYPPLPQKSVYSRPVHPINNPMLQVANHQKPSVPQQKTVPDEPPPAYTPPSNPLSIPEPVKTSAEREAQGLPPSYEETIGKDVKKSETKEIPSLYPDLSGIDDQLPDIVIPKVIPKQAGEPSLVQPKEVTKPIISPKPAISESLRKRIGRIKVGPPVKKPKPKRNKISKPVREHKPAPPPPSKNVHMDSSGSVVRKENKSPDVPTPAPSGAPPLPPPPPIGRVKRNTNPALPPLSKVVTEEKKQEKPALPQGERPFKASDLQDQWEKIKAKSKNVSNSQDVNRGPAPKNMPKTDQEKMMEDLAEALKRRRRSITSNKDKKG
ncbi:hypothetical protein [Parendozoicomonas sp. Alg238-R29]|uniref:hypothetical protein n=1 Tax=Parendozoicomonas sp. Alg238-R29 TaxID=2993446 RepID=UPI00248EAEA6|nr:hypothetical protein [Parendozoicomonas sp. Alg238-R29]